MRTVKGSEARRWCSQISLLEEETGKGDPWEDSCSHSAVFKDLKVAVGSAQTHSLIYLSVLLLLLFWV